MRCFLNICIKTQAKVVITSSWRGSETYTPQIYHILRKILKEHNIPVLGDAPYINAKFAASINPKKSYTLNEAGDISFESCTGREAEVAKYIKDNGITQFVILDDEDWDWVYYGLDKHWCRPIYYDKQYGGLQPEHIEKAIRLLSSFKQKTAVNFSCLRMNALLLFPLFTISACFLIFPLMVISTLGFYIFFYFF